MKVGDYVRTRYGKIGRIIDIEKCISFEPITYQEKLEELQKEEISIGVDTNYHFEDEKDRYFLEDIIKSSPNIIDLIEVGDYVNGYYVNEITDIESALPVLCIMTTNWVALRDIDIKSIVTREQFESMEYKVGE